MILNLPQRQRDRERDDPIVKAAQRRLMAVLEARVLGFSRPLVQGFGGVGT